MLALVAVVAALALSTAACGRSSLRTIGENSRPAGSGGGAAGVGGHAGNVAGSGGHAGTTSIDGGAGSRPDGSAGRTGVDGGMDSRPDARPVSLLVSPSVLTLASGASGSLTATLVFSDATRSDVTAVATWTSSDGVVAVVRGGQVFGLRPGKALVTATANGLTTSSTVVVNGNVTLVGFGIDPPFTTLPIGGVAQLTATAVWSDGSVSDATGSSAWSSSSPSVASVMGGFVVAATPGTTTILATFNGVTAKASVNVSPATVVQVTVQPGFAATTVGMRAVFTADALLSDGSHADVTRVAMWGTDNPGVATVSGGVATGVGVGGAVISAAFGGFTGFAKLGVSGAKLVALQVDPIDPEVGVGATLFFTVLGILSDGSRVDLTAQTMWSSSAPDVLALDGGGHGVARAGGTSIVTAAAGGLVGTTTVTVTPASLVSLAINPQMSVLSIGGVERLTAIGTFSDGTTVDLTSSVMWSTTPTGIVSVSNAPGSAGLATALAAGSTTVVAMRAGLGAKAIVTVTPATLKSITVTPAMSALPVATSEGLTATGTFSDGTVRDITSDVSWSSADPSIATVSNGPFARPGVVTGVKQGDVKIIATEGSVQGVAVVSVVGATISQIVVTPADATTTVGLRSTYTATGVFSDGTKVDVTTQVTWTTDDVAVASISNVAGAEGQLAARAAGKTTVRAAMNGVTGQATVVVTDAAATSLSIAPVTPTVPLGTGLQFTATLILSNGTQRNVTAQATWTSSNAMIATISRTGRATSVSAGTTTISAAFMGLTASTTLRITDAVVTSVEVTPIAPKLNVGNVTPFQATAILSDGTTRNVTQQATWVSSAPGVAAVTTARQRGVVTAVSVGSATIGATYMGLQGSTTVTVSDAVVVSISVSPTGASMPIGTREQFTAQAIRSDGTSFGVTGQATWQSDTPAVAQVATVGGARGQVTAIKPGTAKISATYMGITGSATVTVTDATLTTIQVTPFNETISVGEPLRFVATALYSDGTNTAVTGMATWQSSNDMVAGVSNAGGSRGLATALAKGTTTISATFMGVTGSTTLTVTDATITKIQVTPFAPTLPEGFDLRMRATAIYSDGTNGDVTALVTWTSSDDTIAAVSDALATKGLVSSFVSGEVTIEAQYAGVVGSTGLTVTSAQLTNIWVSPSVAAIDAGDVQAYSARGEFDDGTQIDISAFVTWTSTDIRVADISNADGSRGQATGFATGTTTIIAQRGAVLGKAMLDVR
jgi:hypothetical protein